MKIDILFPRIFPKDKVFSGITKRNERMFPKTGLTFAQSEICTHEEVENHKSILANQINMELNDLKFQHQVHGVTIQKIDYNSALKDSDGMLTDKKSLALCVKIADCCAILVYDTKNNVIGAFHSGWRSTKQNIASIGISEMAKEYGTNAKDLLIYLSPCASGKNFEVGVEVAECFPESSKPLPNGKFLFDNINEITKQLLKTGIKTENIEVAGICTIEDTEYHSYRRDGNDSGRMCAFIGLY